MPGLLDLDETAQVVHAIALPLNVLWSPGVDLEALSRAGVSRVSTGSALYRYAMAAGLEAARAALTGAVPRLPPVSYDDLQTTLTRPAR